MLTYNRSYLEEIMETQGELFERVKEYAPGIDVCDFIENYMNSSVRRLIDEGQAYLCTMEAEDLFNYFLINENYQVRKGEDIGGFLPNWIGQFYAYYQWIYKIPSKEVIYQVPLDFLISGYAGLHDLDIDVAVKKVGEQIQSE